MPEKPKQPEKSPALFWYASPNAWITTTKTERIVVYPITYKRFLREQLAKRGIELKTYREYIAPAEAAWKKQCEAEHEIQRDLEFWKTCPDVEVTKLREE